MLPPDDRIIFLSPTEFYHASRRMFALLPWPDPSSLTLYVVAPRLTLDHRHWFSQLLGINQFETLNCIWGNYHPQLGITFYQGEAHLVPDQLDSLLSKFLTPLVHALGPLPPTTQIHAGGYPRPTRPRLDHP